MIDDASQLPAVKILGGVLIAVVVAVCGLFLWISETQYQREEAWDTVPLGARCPTLGAEERSYGGRPAHCVSFLPYGIQVWSSRTVDLKKPIPAPASPREAQVRVCMHQLDLDQLNCETGISQYENAEQHPR